MQRGDQEDRTDTTVVVPAWQYNSSAWRQRIPIRRAPWLRNNQDRIKKFET